MGATEIPVNSQIADACGVHLGNSPRGGQALASSMQPEGKGIGATEKPSQQSNWTAHELAALFIKIKLQS